MSSVTEIFDCPWKGRRLKVSNPNGSIRIKGLSGEIAHFTAEKKAEHGDPAAIKIELKESSDEIAVVIHMPPSLSQAQVDLSVEISPSAELSLTLDNGVVHARAVGGTTQIVLGSGISQVGYAPLLRNVRHQCRAMSGKVQLAIPSTFEGNVDLHAGAGSITHPFPFPVEGTAEKWSRGQVGQGSGSIQIDLGAGTIDVELSSESPD